MQNQFQFSHAWQILRQSFQASGKALAKFVVHRPRASSRPLISSQDYYSSKAGFYTYLPEREALRERLERLYSEQ